MKTYTMILALAFIWILFGFLTDWIFFSSRNLSNLFRQMTIVSFLSIGMVLVIVTGNIDLSVGSAVGLVSAAMARLHVYVIPSLLEQWFPPAEMGGASLGLFNTSISIIVGLIIGLLIGIWQGWIVAYRAVPSFIVTLGGMLVFRGGVLGATQGKTIVPIEESLVWIAQGYLPKTTGVILGLIVIAAAFLMMFRNRQLKAKYSFSQSPIYVDVLKVSFLSLIVISFVYLMNNYRGIPFPVLLMGIVAFIVAYISTNTKFGRYCYALGGNKEATMLSGINTKKIIFFVFILMGVLSGISGIALTGYVAAGTVGGGINYELEAIAACVIGGTSLMGGEGTIPGAIVGSLIMASLLNGMSVMNMPIFWQFIIRGMVLILAVYMDVVSKKRRVI